MLDNSHGVCVIFMSLLERIRRIRRENCSLLWTRRGSEGAPVAVTASSVGRLTRLSCCPGKIGVGMGRCSRTLSVLANRVRAKPSRPVVFLQFGGKVRRSQDGVAGRHRVGTEARAWLRSGLLFAQFRTEGEGWEKGSSCEAGRRAGKEEEECGTQLKSLFPLTSFERGTADARIKSWQLPPHRRSRRACRQATRAPAKGGGITREMRG